MGEFKKSVPILLISLFLFSAFAPIAVSKETDNQSTNETSAQPSKEDKGKEHNNVKDLIREIPSTDNTPLILKIQALEEINSIQIGSEKKEKEESKKLEKIIEHINKSLQSTLWWDENHIKSVKEGEKKEQKIETKIFDNERKAAQTLRELIDREKKSNINQSLLLSALIKLLQADQKLAFTAIEDAKKASSYVNDSKLSKKISNEIEKAQKEYDKALQHIAKGDPIVAIEFFEKAWKHASEAIAIADENTAPIVTIASPQNNSYTNTSTANVSGSVSDVALYTIKTVTLTLNGASTEIPLVDGKFNHKITLTEGANSISVSAKDLYNNMGSASISVILDTIPPSITIIGIENGKYYNTNVSPQITIYDINLNSTSIKLNGAPYQSGTIISEEGTYLLEIYARDTAGNTAHKNVSFVIDKTPPAVTIANPADGSYLRQTVQIIGSATDLHLDKVSLSINGVKVSSNASYSWDTTKYADGSYTIVLNATDKAGNSAYASVAVTVDNTPPAVTLSYPTNGSFLRGIVNISGSVTDANLANVSLKIGDVEVSSTAAYEWDTAKYPDGSHNIALIALDKAGNTASVGLSVIVDNSPPEITILTPKNGSYINQDIAINASIVEANLEIISVKINGSEVSDALPYNWNTSNYSDGSHVIEVYAIDKASNEASETITVIVDNTPPTIEITTPANNSYIASREVIVNWNAGDNFGIASYEVILDDASPISATETSETLANLTEGLHNVEVKAFDLANNSASAFVSFTVDTLPPEISITGVEDGAYYNVSVSANIEVIDANLNSILALLNGDPYLSGTMITDEGVYLLEVYADDLAGNAAFASLSFVIDKTPPEVSITSPLDGSFVKGIVEITGSATDVNLDAVSLSIDGKEVSNILPYSWNTSNYSDSSYTIELIARDQANNSASADVTVIVDNTPPVVTITDPINKSLVNGTVSIEGSVIESNLASVSLLINGTNVSSSLPYPWNTTNYTDGNYTIELIALDKASNSASTSVTVMVANLPPNLLVTEMNLYPTLENPAYTLIGETDVDSTVTINGAPIPLTNGTFTYSTNLTEGINIITVISTNPIGLSTTWSKTILIDRDLLPDWYEINVTSTDPLNADSDSSKTPENEAGNNVTDDREDFDNDGLTNLQEFRLGANPFASDTDGDGLTDSFEVFKIGTNPTTADTDGNNVTDADEDLDADGLTNLQEQSSSTDPLDPDTDGDTLNDGYEINTLRTNPLSRDTDGDGLDDDSEVKLGTDPLLADSDGDGKPDGNETYLQTFVNATAGVEATIDGVGDVSKNIIVGIAEEPSVLVTSLPNVMKITEISTPANISWAYVKIYYDPAQVSDPSELRMFYYNDSDNSLHLIDKQGVNTQEYYVWGNVTHLSIFGISTPSDWFNTWYVDWQQPQQVFKPGERMRIKAKVRNVGAGSASSVEVEFRENSQSGTLIGTTIIPSIASGSSSLTSIEWTVKYGVSQVCVNVDPSNLIVEVSEGNNNACKSLDKIIDSDGDGLTDYEETNGMRVAFPNAFIKTDPNKADTDGDGLTDGEEMGSVVYDSWNKLEYDLLRVKYGWPAYDGYHYEYKADPRKADTDGDGLDDKQELELGLNPFVYSPYTLIEAGWGFLCGHFCADDPNHENIPFLSGWIVSGFLVFGDIRDLPSTVIEGDWLDFGLTVIALAPVIGDAESTLSKLTKMASKSDKMMLDVFEFAAKNNKLTPHLVKAIDAVTGNKASTLIAKGAKEEDIVHVAKSRGNFKETRNIVKDSFDNTRWLEEGSSASGWRHILSRHKDDFISKFGISTEGEIEDLIYRSVKAGTPNSIPIEKGGGTAYIYYVASDKPMTTIVGSNGYIVTAYPGLPKL